MKIVQYCEYVAPAKDAQGTERVVECLTGALVEQGHDVVMKLKPGSTNTPAPLVDKIPDDCDIIHYHGYEPHEYDKRGIPWVTTIHGYCLHQFPEYAIDNPKIIAISKFVADRIRVPNYVHNCIDPNQFVFSGEKEDYFVWMGGTDWGEAKGLFSSIVLAKKLGIRLKIAGTGRNQKILDTVKSFCNNKIQYVGAVNGAQKANLLAKAKGVLNIGKIEDAFCLVGVEALISGTPVIARRVGAHPEVLNNDVAFLCDSDRDIVSAIMNIHKKDPQKCHQYAYDNFGKAKIAKDYVNVYEAILKRKDT